MSSVVTPLAPVARAITVFGVLAGGAGATYPGSADGTGVHAVIPELGGTQAVRGWQPHGRG